MDTVQSEHTHTERSHTGYQMRLHLGFALSALLFVVLYSTTYIHLTEIWAHTGTFQYAFLIFPIAAALVVSRRGWLARLVARPRPRAAWLLGGLGLFWLVGAAGEINLAQHIAVVMVWPVLVYLFYGPRVSAALAFPLGYLVFAIPFGNFLVGPLQTVTAHLAVGALKLTGVPVIMSGHFIDTPAAAWHVAEACSGIKFFVALTAFGVLYAHLFYNSWRRRILFVIAAMVVPILANGLRVYFTILIGEVFGVEYATGSDHMIFGWQFFGLVLILLFLAGWPWHEPPPKPPAADRGVAAADRGVVRRVSGLALALIILPAAWFAATGALIGQSASASAPADLPSQLAGLSAVGPSQTMSGMADVQTHLNRRYGSPSGETLTVDYLGVAPGQDVTALRHSLFDADQWQVLSGPTSQTAGNDTLACQSLDVSAGEGRPSRHLCYMFRIGSQWSDSVGGVKRRQLLARLTGQAPSQAMLVVTTASNTPPVAPARMAAAAADALATARAG